MVTLIGTIRTLTTTRIPDFVIPLKFFNRSGVVTFRNGSKFRLTWPEFLMLRDTYQYWPRYTVEQMANGLFKIRRGKSEFVGSLRHMCAIFELTEKHNCTVEQKNHGTFRLSGGSFILVGSPEMLVAVKELFSGMYDCDCHGKTVLDIGGFEGESAVYFSSLGAKKVILYEPIPVQFQSAKQNIERNDTNAELYNEGIAEADGVISIEYSTNKATCSVKNVASVILESGADIAKIDCEGAEESLVHVSNRILQSISLYMIEVHTRSIRDKILMKFKEAGFVLARDFRLTKDLSVVHLKRHVDNALQENQRLDTHSNLTTKRLRRKTRLGLAFLPA